MPKRTIYLPDEILEMLRLPPREDAAEEYSFSGRIASVIERYDRIIRDAMPEFSDKEWLAIFDANNGTAWDGASATLAWANVADSEGLGEKWGIDEKSLVRRMRALSTPSAIAVVEAVERFWRQPSLGHAEGLKAAGVVK